MPLQPNQLQSPASRDSLARGFADSTAPSLFRNDLLEPAHEGPVLHDTQYDYGIAVLLLFAFALFVWLYATNRKRLMQVVRAFYINRFANQLARDEISFGNRVSLFLSSLFIITITLFLFQVNQYYGYLVFESDLKALLVIAGALLGAYLVKMLIVRLIGFVFLTQKEAGDYIASLFLFANALGLFMMPVVICLAFARDLNAALFIYTGLGIIGTFLCIRLIRGLIIGINSIRVSGFYLFLYLCTLEILPFVLLIKIFLLKIK